jgi:hypothetical protein
MFNKYLLTLDEDMILSGPKQKLVRLYNYFILSDENQTNNKKSYSAKYLVQRYGSNKELLLDNFKNELSEYLLGHFDEVTITAIATTTPL